MIQWCNDFVCVPVYAEGDDMATWVRLGALSDVINPKTKRSSKMMWEEQCEVLREALQMVNSRFIYRLIVLCWPRGDGKCERKGSKILSYDGTIKKVEDVKVGDLLMGDDNTPRKVLSLANGREEMFEVIPFRGESMTVTSDHVLSLKRRRSRLHKRGKPFKDNEVGKIVDIKVSDYQKQNRTFKNLHLLYKVPINWPHKEVPIDPYFLGIWLGDGNKNTPEICTMDQEVVDYLYQFADKNELNITVKCKGETNKAKSYALVRKHGMNNPLLDLMRENNLLFNKHIPQVYKINSREIRLQILAGIIDADGCINRNSFELTLKNKTLSDDVAFIARSLGFHVDKKQVKKGIKSTGFVGEYQRLGISGDCSIIPVRVGKRKCTPRSNWKDVLTTGIKDIKSVGEQEYYGFMLDGNGRYVKEDFTVTHNSLLACLIELWKFFNWPRQQIMLGANSKEQTKFVHYDIIRDIIINSPRLYEMIGGERNIQEKEIRIVDAEGNVRSMIRSISSFSGIVSNITGYTFSEIFDMKNPKFFVQLDGSIRTIPNALGVIDSTVSAKDHILYKLYVNFMMGKSKTVFFSYRFSRKGDVEDYWNPNMDEDQLKDYETKFPLGDFERYFLNKWNSGNIKVFSKEQIEEISLIGADNYILNHETLHEILVERTKVEETIIDLTKRQKAEGQKTAPILHDKHQFLTKRLQKVDSLYVLKDQYERPCMLNNSGLQQLGDRFQTDWSILTGIDMADPYAIRGKARSIVTVVAKGLAGSKDNPFAIGTLSPKYIYFLLMLAQAEKNSIDNIKDLLDEADNEYQGLDTLCSERYGIWDMEAWCEERTIKFEPVFPNYDRQKEAFKEYYIVIKEGRYKMPMIYLPGSKNKNIFVEEHENFDHDSETKWFGSTEKNEVRGIQDDTVFSGMWCFFGGRMLTASDFRPRLITSESFGYFQGNKELVGNY